MAKGQIRTTKETKKPKTSDKKKVPRYMQTGGLGQASNSSVSGVGQKK